MSKLSNLSIPTPKVKLMPKVYALYMVLLVAILAPAGMLAVYGRGFIVKPVGAVVSVFCLAIFVAILWKFKDDFRARGPWPFAVWFIHERAVTPLMLVSGIGLGFVAGLALAIRNSDSIEVGASLGSSIALILAGFVFLAVALYVGKFVVRFRYLWTERREDLAYDDGKTLRGTLVHGQQGRVIFGVIVVVVLAFAGYVASLVYGEARANPNTTIETVFAGGLGLLIIMVIWTASKRYNAAPVEFIERELHDLTDHVGHEVREAKRTKWSRKSKQPDDTAVIPTYTPPTSPPPQTSPTPISSEALERMLFRQQPEDGEPVDAEVVDDPDEEDDPYDAEVEAAARASIAASTPQSKPRFLLRPGGGLEPLPSHEELAMTTPDPFERVRSSAPGGSPWPGTLVKEEEDPLTAADPD